MKTMRYIKRNNSRKKKIKSRKGLRRRPRMRGGDAVTYPPESIKKYIHHVLYINLDSRTDRKEQIEKELQIFNPEQVHRVPGVQEKEYPYLGCTKGHLNAVQLAADNGWDNVLILEDDAKWDSIDTAYPIFEKLVNNPYDVIMLGGTHSEFDKTTFKISKSQSSASYLVNKSYYPTIIAKLKEVIANFKPGITPDIEISPDAAMFFPLQATGSWFLVSPSLMIQAKSYSNIQKMDVNYAKNYV
jgi:GR25 family glycosyltransferase involved in LPS biosynthesis